MARKPKIVIVGGGTSGLAAAYTLRSKYGNKLEVVVLEAADRAGGRIAGEEIDGFSIHTGASVFHESFETVWNLAENLGVPLKMSPRKKGGHIYRDGKLWGIYSNGSLKQMMTTVQTILSFRLLTPKAMWQSIRLVMMLKARSKDIRFQDHSRMLDLDTHESFAEFMEANSLTEYLKQAGEADINCFTAGFSEQVGAAFGMALLWLWTLNQSERPCLPEGGVGEFANALVGACAGDIRLSTPVQRIVLEEGTVKGVIVDGGEAGEVEADAVICATPATKAVEIIPDLPSEVERVLARITYSSCINMAIGLDENILPEGSHAAIFPPDSGTFLTFVSNLASMAPCAAPEGKSLVYALVIGEHAQKLFTMSDTEIADRIIEEIRKYLPAMPDNPLFTRVYRWPEALCLAPGGMLREIHEMRQHQLADLKGLFLAGDYMRMPSCNGALLSGVDAAEECASFVFRDAV